MNASVYVGGVRLDSIGTVSDLQDSTIWRYEGGYSGDYEASWSWGVEPDFQAAWFQAGALVQIFEDGVEVWRGFLGEPSPGDVMECVAYGSGADAANFLVSDGAAVALDAEVDAANGRGLRFARFGNAISSTTTHLGEASEPMTLDVALDRYSQTLGQVWWVQRGEVSLRTEATAAKWQMAPNSAYMGTTDENFATALVGTYVAVVDSDGAPVGWGKTSATDPDAIAKWGRLERSANLNDLGLLSDADAAVVLANVLAQVGARMAWTNGFTMTDLNSVSTATGAPGPMGVRAGDRVLLTGLSDMRTSTTYRGSASVVLGKVRRIHAEGRAVCEPVGMVRRDFGALTQPKTRPPSSMSTWRLAGAA